MQHKISFKDTQPKEQSRSLSEKELNQLTGALTHAAQYDTGESPKDYKVEVTTTFFCTAQQYHQIQN